MTTLLRRFRALPRPLATPDAARLRLLDRMRSKAGHDATFFTVRARPQTDRRASRR